MFKSHLLAVIVLGSFAATSVATAATSGSVTLGGTVASSLAVVSTSTAGATTLDLSGGEKIVKVADIDMGTNNEQGLTLTATAGNLTKAGGSSIAFLTTSVADEGSVPVSGSFEPGTYSIGTSNSGATSIDLYILYSPLALQDPGNYGGGITLTVSDN
jgi:hypothetical protein